MTFTIFGRKYVTVAREDGWEVRTTINNDPVLVITGEASEEHVIRLTRRGIYLESEGFNSEAIESELERILL